MRFIYAISVSMFLTSMAAADVKDAQAIAQLQQELIQLKTEVRQLREEILRLKVNQAQSTQTTDDKQTESLKTVAAAAVNEYEKRFIKNNKDDSYICSLITADIRRDQNSLSNPIFGVIVFSTNSTTFHPANIFIKRENKYTLRVAPSNGGWIGISGEVTCIGNSMFPETDSFISAAGTTKPLSESWVNEFLGRATKGGK